MFCRFTLEKAPNLTDKNRSKRHKKMFYTFHTHRRNFIKKSADFCGLHIFEKSLDFCGKLIYYSVRYSGIVQSVEQRTVNPYVTGSSPVARATNIKGSSRNPFSLIFLLLPICYPRQHFTHRKNLELPGLFTNIQL